MLETLRNSVNSIWAKILLGVIIISFAVFGLQGIVAQTGTVVAKVGNAEITADEFSSAVQGRIQQYARATGQSLPVSQLREQGIDRTILEEMAIQASIEEDARIMGLSASDQDVANAIGDLPSFRAAGRFEEELYDLYLNRSHQQAKNFEKQVRTDLARRQLLEAVAIGTSAPRELSEALYTYQSEQRELNYILLTPESAQDPGEPTEDQIIAFHNDNPDEQFTAPEYRALSVVFLTVAQLAEEIDVSEEAIRETYDERRGLGEFVSVPSRTVQQIPFDTEEAALSAYDAIVGGRDFATIAAENGVEASAIDLGTVQRGTLPGALDDAAFEATENGVIEPVKNLFGWTVLNITNVAQPVISPFEDVKDRIRLDLARELARDQILDEMTDLDDELAGGSSPAQAASATKARHVSIPMIDARGQNAEGELVADLPAIPELLPAAFDAEIGEEPVVKEIEGGFYAYVVDSVTESQIRNLQDVRGDVISAWKLDQRTEALAGISQGLRTRLESGESLETLAAAEGYQTITAGPIVRTQRPQHMTEELRNGMFSNEVGGILDGRADSGAGYVLGVVGASEGVSEDERLAAIDRLNETYAAQLSQDLMRGYTRSARERHSMSINHGVIEQVLTNIGQYN